VQGQARGKPQPSQEERPLSIPLKVKVEVKVKVPVRERTTDNSSTEEHREVSFLATNHKNGFVDRVRAKKARRLADSFVLLRSDCSECGAARRMAALLHVAGSG